MMMIMMTMMMMMISTTMMMIDESGVDEWLPIMMAIMIVTKVGGLDDWCDLGTASGVTTKRLATEVLVGRQRQYDAQRQGHGERGEERADGVGTLW